MVALGIIIIGALWIGNITSGHKTPPPNVCWGCGESMHGESGMYCPSCRTP